MLSDPALEVQCAPSPLASVPKSLRGRLRDAHRRPLVSWAKGTCSFRVPCEHAWNYPLVEFPRTGNSYATLTLDLDSREAALDYCADALLGPRGFPQPNFIVERLATGHLQAHYCLATPVHRGPEAREGPLRLLVHVSEFLIRATGADLGYSGVLARNPVERVHRGARATDGPCRTLWVRPRPYSLIELSKVVPFGWRRPQVVFFSRGT